MNKTRERIKNILICVLLLGMVYLTYLVWFFDSPFGELEILDIFHNEEESYMINEGTGSDTESFGIRPIGVFLCDGEGGRGAIYESGAAETLYHSVRDEIAEIVGKMSSPTSVSEKEWSSAISSKGVLLDYSGNIPVDSLFLWFGREGRDSDFCARYFMFSADGTNVVMYAKNTKTGSVEKFTSNYSSKSLLQKTERLTAVKKASLAIGYEEDDFRAVDDETLIVEKRAKLPQIVAHNAVETMKTETVNGCLTAFRLRDATVGTYLEQDGTIVYVADMVTLKITPGGTASYTDARESADETLGIEVQYDGEDPTLAEKVETARILATTLASSVPGRGGLYIKDVFADRNKIEVVFGRTINGVPVKMKDTSYFIRIQIENEMVKSARVNLRYYESTSQLVDVFPERIAIAAMNGHNKKGSLMLFYCDDGESEAVSAEWYTEQASDKGGTDSDGVVES